MLSLMLNVVIFEECRCQWSMSRPLLALILLEEDFFRQLRAQIVQAQIGEAKQRMMDLVGGDPNCERGSCRVSSI
jgi:exportin-7